MVSIYYLEHDHYKMTNELESLSLLKKKEILWVDMLGWREEDEVLIEKQLGVQIMNRRESLEIEQSSRFIEYEDHVVCQVDFVTKEGLTLVPKIVSFTLGKDFLITNREYAFRSFTEITKKVFAAHKGFTSSDVFLAIFNTRIANDADLVEELSGGISVLSKEVTNQKNTSTQLILKLNYFRENLMLMMQNCINKKLLISVLKKTPYLTRQVESELDTSVKDLESVIDYIRFNFERLDFIDSTLNHLITFDQNNSLKIFTIVSLFFMPPMLIASIYGMNFQEIPELTWEFGYPYALLLMFLTLVATFIYFKRKRWL